MEDTGQAENTIVIYTSDHGDMCGSHRMIDKHYIMYDDVVKVPLAIRWPQMISPGMIIDEFICHDIPATLLDILEWTFRTFLRQVPGSPFHGEKVEGWRTEAVATCNGQQCGLYPKDDTQ